MTYELASQLAKALHALQDEAKIRTNERLDLEVGQDEVVITFRHDMTRWHRRLSFDPDLGLDIFDFKSAIQDVIGKGRGKEEP